MSSSHNIKIAGIIFSLDKNSFSTVARKGDIILSIFYENVSDEVMPLDISPKMTRLGNVTLDALAEHMKRKKLNPQKRTVSCGSISSSFYVIPLANGKTKHETYEAAKILMNKFADKARMLLENHRNKEVNLSQVLIKHKSSILRELAS